MNDTNKKLDGRLLLEVSQRMRGPNRRERAVAEARKIQAEGRTREYLQKLGIIEAAGEPTQKFSL